MVGLDFRVDFLNAPSGQHPRLVGRTALAARQPVFITPVVSPALNDWSRQVRAMMRASSLPASSRGCSHVVAH